MTEIIHNNMRLISSRDAARRFAITNDYVGRLCKKQKVRGALISGSWYVEEESLREFLLQVNREKYARREALRKERARDYHEAQVKKSENLPVSRSKSSIFRGLTIPPRALHVHAARRRAAQVRSRFVQRATATMFALIVVVSGLTFSDATVFRIAREQLPASASLASRGYFDDRGSQSALASLFGFQRADSAYWIWHDTSGEVIPPDLSSYVKSDTPTIIERVVEAVVPDSVVSGISESLFNARLSALEERLLAVIALIPPASTVSPVYHYYVDNSSGIGGAGFDDIDITNSSFSTGTISGSTISSSNISGTAITSSTFTGDATTTNLYVESSFGFGTASGLLRADSGAVSTLTNGANGQVLKIVGGNLAWSTDLSGGAGGGGAWATTTDDLAIYPVNTSYVTILGDSATTTTGNILEIAGNSLMRGTLTAYSTISAPIFTATSTSATSTFPRLNITGSLGLGSDYVTDLTGNGLTIQSGALSLDTSGDWTGTFDGQEGSWYRANSFSTTSVDYYVSQTNLSGFSTTSANYWKTQNNFFSTTSALHFSSLGLAFSTTSTDAWKSERNFFSTTSNEYWKSVNNFFSTTSADYYISQQNLSGFSTTSALHFSSLGLAFSTTSTDHWKSVNNFFSTTSIAYYNSVTDLFSTTSANYFVHASTTIPKTYTANTFSTLQTFSNASSTLFSSVYASTTNLFAGTLTLHAPLAITSGGTGTSTAPTYGQLLVGNAVGGFDYVATSSLGIVGGGGLSFAYPFPNNATSTLISFNGGLTTSNATSTTLGITGLPSALLATRADGSVYATTSISSSLLDTSGNWSGTFDGQEGSYYLANSFSTTSANYFSSLGLGFSTTSSDYWKTTNNFFSTTSALHFSSLGLAFSTTSTDAWKNERNFFSTTSSEYWKSVSNFFSTTSIAYYNSVTDLFSTTSANYFVSSSTTIPKTYTANTFSALQTFTNASSTLLSSVYASSTQAFFGNLSLGNLSGVLKATGGVVTAAVAGVDYLTSADLFAYPFPNNATSTTLTFSQGLLSLASTTIGNGTQTGGLTVSGGATTTSNLYIGGSVIAAGSPQGAPTIQGIHLGSAANYAEQEMFGTAGALIDFSGTSGRDLDFRLIFTPSTNDLQFQSSSTAPILTLKGAGNVGIGTTTPGSLLSVGNTNGINFSTATSTFNSTGGINLAAGCFAVNGTCISGGGGSGTVGSGTTGQFPYYAANGTTLTATSSLFLATSGNVGIGSGAPSALLTIDHTGNTTSSFGNGAIYVKTDTTNFYENFDYDYGMVFRATGDAWATRFTGTNNMSSTGEIVGIYKSETSDGDVGNGSGSPIAVFNNDGNVGIGTTTLPATLTVNGVTGQAASDLAINAHQIWVGPQSFNDLGGYVNNANLNSLNVFTADSASTTQRINGLVGWTRVSTTSADFGIFDVGVSGYVTVEHPSGDANSGIAGLSGEVYINSSGNVDTSIGLFAKGAGKSGSGTLSDAISVWAYGPEYNEGNITRAYGVFANNLTDNASTTYAFYSDSGIGSYTNYALYTAGTAPSYFGGKVGVGQSSPIASFTVTPRLQNHTNIATTFLVGTSSALAATAGSYLYPFEFQNTAGSGGNTSRLQIAPYRRVAGTSWEGTGYRLQYAVDSSFTTGSKAYIEVGAGDSTSGGGNISLGTNGSDRLYINNSGYVGVGTSTPNGRLTISSDGFDNNNVPTVIINETDDASDFTLSTGVKTDTYGRWAMTAGGTQRWGPGGASSQDTFLYRSAANTLTIDSNGSFGSANLLVSGNVGIGVPASPDYSLHIGDFSSVIATTTIASPNSLTWGSSLAFLENSTTGFVLRHDTAGNNLVLASGSGTFTGHISIARDSGNVTFTGSGGTCTINGSGACSSDERLKTNINEFSGADALEKLSLIRSVTYNWADPSLDQDERLGVIAQDVLQAFPQLVGTATTTLNGVPGSYYTVNYAGLTSPLIAAINELHLDLSTIASTTASTTASSESFASSFFANLFARMTQWLADAGNGIQEIFAKTIQAENVYADTGTFNTTNTEMLCVGEVCVTEDEFAAVFGAGAGTSSGNTDHSGTSTPPEPPTNEPIDDEGAVEEIPNTEDGPPAEASEESLELEEPNAEETPPPSPEEDAPETEPTAEPQSETPGSEETSAPEPDPESVPEA